MALERSSDFNGLKVCMKCGWPMAGPFDEREHKGKCSYVHQGAAADELARRIPLVPSTKFGYGTGQLVFNFSKNFHVRFEARSNGLFSLEDVWLLDDVGPDAAEVLVQSLGAWMKTFSL